MEKVDEYLASWIVETRTNTCLTANCPNCPHPQQYKPTPVPKRHMKEAPTAKQNQSTATLCVTIEWMLLKHEMTNVQAYC